MFGYNNEELLQFFKEQIEGYSLQDIALGHVNHVIGQGISRTVFSYTEYPDLVFKIGIGSDEELDNNIFDVEDEIFQSAIDSRLAHFFSPLEYIGSISFIDDLFGDSDEETRASVYIQSQIYSTIENLDLLRYEDEELCKERKILSILKKREKRFIEISNSEFVDAYFYRKYGVDTFLEMAHFLWKEGITDLHDGNWGITQGKDLVLIDYAM